MSSAFALSFVEPAYAPVPEAEDIDEVPAPVGGLQMSKGARQAARELGVSDQQVLEALASPAEVEPDPSGKGRTRVRGNGLFLVVAADGFVLNLRRR